MTGKIKMKRTINIELERNRWILEKHKCPLCGAELSYVYHGYPIAEYEEYLKSKGVNYILGIMVPWNRTTNDNLMVNMV